MRTKKPKTEKKTTLVNLSSPAVIERIKLGRKLAAKKKKKKKKPYKSANAVSVEAKWRDGWFSK